MRREDFGILVFNPETFFVITTNESGRKLLKLCDGSRSLHEILLSIRPRNKNIRNSAESFLTKLISAGIIREVGDNE